MDHLKRISREKSGRMERLNFEDVEPLLYSVSQALQRVVDTGSNWDEESDRKGAVLYTRFRQVRSCRNLHLPNTQLGCRVQQSAKECPLQLTCDSGRAISQRR
eukprot:COSAG05_NODE_623_length_8291_cov_4.353394_7_plen_103_part_00